MANLVLEDIRGGLKKFIVDQILVEALEEELESETDLIALGILDSMAIIRTINFIKENYQIQIAPEQVMFENFQSIAAISQLVVESGAS